MALSSNYWTFYMRYRVSVKTAVAMERYLDQDVTITSDEALQLRDALMIIFQIRDQEAKEMLLDFVNNWQGLQTKVIAKCDALLEQMNALFTYGKC